MNYIILEMKGLKHEAYQRDFICQAAHHKTSVATERNVACKQTLLGIQEIRGRYISYTVTIIYYIPL